MDRDVDEVIAGFAQAADCVVDREREVDHGPAGDRGFARRAQRIGEWPQMLDGLVGDDRRLIVPDEWTAEAVPVRTRTSHDYQDAGQYAGQQDGDD